MQLLSIAVQSKLVSHTVFNAVHPWMTQLDPNLRTESGGGHRGVFDVWPEDRAPSKEDLDAFAAAARGWLTFCAGRGDRSTELAVRRTAACFGIAGGRFGVEDRLIDAGIALEAMYGPLSSRDITDRQTRERELTDALKSGRELARRTLFRLLARGPVNDENEWDALMQEGQTGARDQ